MYKKSYSNLGHWLLFASLVASVHLTAAQYRRDDISSEEISSEESSEEVTDSISGETTEESINTGKPFSIQSEFGSKRVLGISGSGDGAILILQDPQNTASQQWYMDSDGWTIRSKLNDLCLNSKGPYPAMVKLGPCAGRRVIPFVKNVYDQIQMLHKDDVCLDVSAGNETLGGYVMAKKCQCSNNEILPNQVWSLDYTNNVEAARKRPASRKAIDPKDDDEESAESTEGPDTIDDYDSNENPDESHESTEKPDPNAIPFSIQSEFGSKRVLGISMGGGGTLLSLEDTQNTASQQWYMDRDGWTIRSKLNGLCLNSNGPNNAVTMGPCGASGTHGSRRGPKFVYNHISNQIENYRDDVCLDISSAENDKLGASVIAKNCNCINSKRLNQKWSFDYTTNVMKARKPKMMTTMKRH